MTTAHLTEPFDLVSPPDDDSRDLRNTLTGDALDLVTGLLLLRRALIVLMESTGTEALALPFTSLAMAALVPLRVKHDPRVPDVLQILLPGEGAVTVEGTPPTPGAGYDSEGATEEHRLRVALGDARRALMNDAGRDTVLALLDAALRT